MLTEQCPRASTPLSLATSLLLGSPSQMAEVCQDSSSRGKLYNRSRSQASRDMENHIQLLLHTLVVRYYCHSHERGTGRRNRFRVVAPEMQVDCHRHCLSGNHVVHGWEAMVLRIETVQEAQQVGRAREE